MLKDGQPGPVSFVTRRQDELRVRRTQLLRKEHLRGFEKYLFGNSYKLSTNWYKESSTLRNRAFCLQSMSIQYLNGTTSNSHFPNPLFKHNHIPRTLGLDLGQDFLRSALHDATSNGQASALLQVKINLAGSLATFIDTPER